MKIGAKRRMVGLIVCMMSIVSVRAALAEPMTQVLFICEHGYAKSLMAASYFDQLAKERGLPFRGLSRGSAPNSSTVPPGIVAALKSDGIDIGTYRPILVSSADVSASTRVVTMSTSLPASAVVPGVRIEQWDDVPLPIMYDQSRASIKAHIENLLDELAKPMTQ
jgi:arsenate reductase (thioredoxin)